MDGAILRRLSRVIGVVTGTERLVGDDYQGTFFFFFDEEGQGDLLTDQAVRAVALE